MKFTKRVAAITGAGVLVAGGGTAAGLYLTHETMAEKKADCRDAVYQAWNEMLGVQTSYRMKQLAEKYSLNPNLDKFPECQKIPIYEQVDVTQKDLNGSEKQAQVLDHMVDLVLNDIARNTPRWQLND